MGRELCLVRGGGDIATGIVWRLTRAGWPVVVCELADPLTVRRTVAVSTAVREGAIEIEGMRAQLVGAESEAVDLARSGVVAVLVSSGLAPLDATVVVDARLAKHNIDTSIDDGDLVVGIGPGFTAGVDCHAVVETNRGRHLGRVFWAGSAAADTGIPGEIGGRGAERVLRAPAHGRVEWSVVIGDMVGAGQTMGSVAGRQLAAPFAGVVRGLITEGFDARAGMKIGDLDPCGDRSACWEISDKSLSVGGGVAEAVSSWMIDSD